MRLIALVLVVVLLGAGAAWAIAGDDGASSDQASASGIVIERVSFQADAGVEGRPILSLGGLTIRAWCTDYGARTGTYLSVAAQTAVDDAIVGASFVQKKGPDHSPYTFVQPDFDRSYGAWDFLGTNPEKTSGTLHYSRPDAGQVAVTFLADQDTAQGDCFFGGTATFTPG